MKTVIYTQRVNVVESYGERRDCADQRIPQFLMACGYIPIPVPNVPEIITSTLETIKPSGVFLSGGNSLVKYGGDAPERDSTEKILVDLAIKNGVPTFGICRGMQFLVDYFGAKLSKLDGHVRTRHEVHGLINRQSVNSYHTLGLHELPGDLEIVATAPDGSIEAFRHTKLEIAAVAWHPERETDFDSEDIEMIQKFFK